MDCVERGRERDSETELYPDMITGRGVPGPLLSHTLPQGLASSVQTLFPEGYRRWCAKMGPL